MSKEEEKNSGHSFRRRGDLALPVVIGVFVLSCILAFVLLQNYIRSSKGLTAALKETQNAAAHLTLEECAQRNIHWYQNCHEMAQMCDDTVGRMMKVCVTNGPDKSAQCAKYGDEVLGYNFGLQPCTPYLKDKPMKKACADTWQVIADYCKAARQSPQSVNTLSVNRPLSSSGKDPL